MWEDTLQCTVPLLLWIKKKRILTLLQVHGQEITYTCPKYIGAKGTYPGDA